MNAMKFTYRSGQRPLDGFTLKRGVGQGGFGEVYFAVSDGGKEVALKLLRGHTDAELRGISHCLNLKHPNLVHLYDLRTDVRGEKWVVMEYVFGESLAQVINRHPTGLTAELIREWCAALARGVSYLHDQGVVHRDLKPANIFIEHGHLKIGDYGLSRRMSSSERGGELTRGVGTPHYMAPEIKNGNYGRSIDVYASGVILFEMLTGHPPFEGETPAEVLMKHQLDTPDLGKIPATLRPILQRVLEKDPAKRFGTMMEFARAVEAVLGGERREAAAHPGASPSPPAPGSSDPKIPTAETVVDERLPLPPVSKPVSRKRSGPPGTFRERLAELAGGFSLAPLVTAACTAPCAFIQTATPWSVLARIFLLATLLTWALILIGRFPRRDHKNPWSRRAIQLVVGFGLGTLAFWLDGWGVPTGTASATSGDLILATGHRFSPETFSTGLRYLFYFGLATAACRWWIATDRRRRERVRVFPIIAAAFWGTVFVFLWPWESTPVMVGIAPLVIAAIAAQAASPWGGPPIPIAYPARPRSRPMYA
jgi:eukaryotic-like serine/threonine-protein kinase